MTSTPFHTGWYRLTASKDLPVGSVRSFRACGRELVAFRGENGVATVLDAHCPHLGAHFGHGGKVRLNTLACPFHHFRFGQDGRCAKAEGRARTSHLRTVPWANVEMHGSLYFYFHPQKEAPGRQFPVHPAVEAATRVGRFAQQTKRFEGRAANAAENLVDFRHFRSVHGFGDVSESSFEVEGDILRSSVRFTRPLPFLASRSVRITLHASIYGVGLSVSELQLDDFNLPLTLVTNPTPIDERSFDLTLTLVSRASVDMVPRVLERQLLKLLVHNAFVDAEADRPIWAHRREGHSRYVPGDEGLAAFRRLIESPPAAPSSGF